MQLTQHFTLEEFTRSDTAVRLGIANVPPPSIQTALFKTASMAERVRAHLSFIAGQDIPIRSLSAFRCLELNRAIKSKDTSHHVLGGALDFVAPTFGSPTKIAQVLAPLVNSLGIGQLINEYPDSNGWVHISWMAVEPRNQVITITNRGTFPGILEN